MKKLLYIISILCVALVSCEDTIEKIEFSDQKTVAVLGILNTEGTENRIYCYYVENNVKKAVDDATISLYVDGELVETATVYSPEVIDIDSAYNEYLEEYYYWRTNYEIPYYIINTVFKPGDKVRMELTSASAHANVWAETVVPQPAEVDNVSVDSTVLSLGTDSYPQPYYKVSMRLKSASSTPGNYRLLSGESLEDICGVAIVDIDNNYEKLEDLPDTVAATSNISLIIKDDLALTNGKGYVDNEDEDVSIDTYYYNHYRIVGGEYFNGGEYTVSYYVEPVDSWDDPFWGSSYSLGSFGWLDGIKYHEDSYYVYDNEDESKSHWEARVTYDKEDNRYVYYEVYSLSDEECAYLRSRSNQEDVTLSDSPFIEPVVLKGNINGGTGIFAIEAVTAGRVKLE